MPLPPYLMSNFPSVRPSLNLQFDSQPTPEDMTSHLASVGATFSRASIGTYTDANGLVAEASAGQARPNYSTAGVHEGLLIEESRTNLFPSSNYFEGSEWTKSKVRIESNATISPDGKANASKLICSETGDAILSETISTGNLSDRTFTFKVFAKTDDTSLQARLFMHGATSLEDLKASGDFTLTTEWQVIELTGTFNSSMVSTSLVLRLDIENTGSSNATEGDYIYIYGAQVEEGSFPTSYIPTIPTFSSRASTATYFDSSGVLQTASIDEARTDHKYIDGQWVEAGLLLEGASTNYAKASEDLDNTTYWDFNDVTVSTDTETDPKGGTNSFLLAETAISGTHYLGIDASHRPSVTSGETWTYSIFVKKGDGANAPDIIQVATNTNFNVSLYANFNISSGTVTDSNLCDASVEQYGDWYRIIVTMESSTTGSGNVVLAFCDDNPTASRLPSYAGQTDANVFVWGAQLEQQSQATSYIKTTTASATRSADVYTTATKTRSADVCYIDGTAFTDFYNQEQGTVLIDFDTESYGSTQNLVSINDGTLNNRYVWYFSSSGFLNFRKVVSGSNNQANSGSSITTFLPDIKMVAYYNLLGAGFLIEGTDGNSLSETTQLNLNKLEINSITKWTIKKFIYFPRKLSTAEFEKLTQ